MPVSPNQISSARRGFLCLKTFATLLLVSGAALGHPVFAQTSADPTAVDLQSSNVITLKSATRRVIVDVVVTDPQGRPVTGLTNEVFHVAEDNTPQPTRSFEVHTVAAEVPYVAPKVPPLPPNTFLNILKAPQSGTPTVILYDALNTPIADQAYGHEEMVRFIKHRKPGTQIAIFVLSGKLHLLQGFTDDSDLLNAALASKKGRIQGSTLLAPSSSVASTPLSASPTTASAPGDASTSATDALAAAGGSTTGVLNGDQALQASLDAFAHLDDLEQSQLLDERVEITLDALTQIGRFLASLPGRKNLIWLSSGFPAGILPDSTVTAASNDHGQSLRNFSEQIKESTDLLNLSHVAVYPVDVRGVTVSPVFSAASNSSFGGDPGKLNQAAQKFTDNQISTHATMNSIADSTGGHAYYGTNDLQEAVDKAMTNGSTYYSLTYAPTNPNFDGSLRRIKVTLDKPGYTLSYRKQYFADDLAAAAQAVADAPQSPLTPSLEHGTPLSHELFVEAHLDVGGPPVPATPAQMELLSQYEAMRTRKKKTTSPGLLPPVMMQKYYISYGLIARQLDLPTDDKGFHRASLELGVLSYDEDGRKLNGLDNRVDDSIPPPRFAKLATDGYHAVQAVLIPVTAASVRLAVRDVHSNRIGSIEVQLPLAKTAEATTPELKSLAK